MLSTVCSTTAWEKADINKKWEETGLYKRIQQRKLRASLTDFQRFKVRLLKQQVGKGLLGNTIEQFLYVFLSFNF